MIADSTDQATYKDEQRTRQEMLLLMLDDGEMRDER